MLLKYTYYAHYYAEEQESLSDYYVFYMQYCMSNSLYVADNFKKTVLLECINERYYYALSNDDCSIRVYRSFTIIFTNACY